MKRLKHNAILVGIGVTELVMATLWLMHPGWSYNGIPLTLASGLIALLVAISAIATRLRPKYGVVVVPMLILQCVLGSAFALTLFRFLAPHFILDPVDRIAAFQPIVFIVAGLFVPLALLALNVIGMRHNKVLDATSL